MPQITNSSLPVALGMLALLGVLSVAGCGEENTHYMYDTEQGKHPEGWYPTGHIPSALAQLNTCEDCHGSAGEPATAPNLVGTSAAAAHGALGGGISKVACSQCHVVGFTAAGNPSVHPLDWDGYVYARHASYVQQKGTTNCASVFCHGPYLQGGAGPSCSSCHIGGPLRVHPWNESQDLSATPTPLHAQYIFTHGGTASCRNAVCHGANLQGVLLSGPACSACHDGQVANFP